MWVSAAVDSLHDSCKKAKGLWICPTISVVVGPPSNRGDLLKSPVFGNFNPLTAAVVFRVLLLSGEAYVHFGVDFLAVLALFDPRRLAKASSGLGSRNNQGRNPASRRDGPDYRPDRDRGV